MLLIDVNAHGPRVPRQSPVDGDAAAAVVPVADQVEAWPRRCGWRLCGGVSGTRAGGDGRAAAARPSPSGQHAAPGLRGQPASWPDRGAGRRPPVGSRAGGGRNGIAQPVRASRRHVSLPPGSAGHRRKAPPGRGLPLPRRVGGPAPPRAANSRGLWSRSPTWPSVGVPPSLAASSKAVRPDSRCPPRSSPRLVRMRSGFPD